MAEGRAEEWNSGKDRLEGQRVHEQGWVGVGTHWEELASLLLL